MRLLSLFTFLLLISSCKSNKETTTQATSATSPAPASAPASSSSTANTSSTSSENTGTTGGPETIVIGYEKGACFGTCPVFKMTLNAETNKATYVGTAHVDKVGTYEKAISDEEIMKLKAEFDKAKFLDMNDVYTNEISDLPSTYVSFSMNGKTKTVKERYHAPKELKELELILDKIANSEGWVQIKAQE
ncbi:MAG: hypothetical protein K0Q95_2927 [Bacteroidota bacterium]|jgi:hypothetical protein|nr:hypothetical protein [Bacteroidota bacterium]